MKVVKRYKLLVLRYISSEDEMHNMLTLVRAAVLYIRNSQGEYIQKILMMRKKTTYLLFWCLYEMMDVN